MQTFNGVLSILIVYLIENHRKKCLLLQKDQHHGQHDTDAGGV